jgi:4-amino-4-deoxy-L-arabinose transferase-like glycosyltransferase
MVSFSKYVKILLVGLLICLILSIIVLSYVPPVSRDALIHHLAIPKLYLKHGGIFELPEYKYSYYPMILDLLYLVPLYFGNDIIPKLIHFSFSLMTAWLIFGYLKNRLDSCYALFGVLLFLSTPIIVKLSITAYVDLGLIFFSYATIIYLIKWFETDFKIKYLIFSAIWCGLALSTKYNGLIVLFLMTVFVPFIYLRSIHSETFGQGRAIGYSAVFIIVSLMVFSPWMIKNYAWTNNPIYPLYDNVLNPKKAISIKSKLPGTDSSDTTNHASGAVKKPTGRWGSFVVRKVIYGEKWWETALIPIRIFFQGKDENPKYFDGKLNPILFIFPFFAFIGLKKNNDELRTEKKLFFIFSVLFFLFVFFQADMRIRWIGPIIPPLIILSVHGLYEIISFINKKYSGAAKKTVKCFIFVFITSLLGLNVVYLIDRFRIVKPLDYLSGRVGRDEYIENYRPEYATINYANHHIPHNSKILCMFLGNRSYYSDREVVFDYNLAPKTIIQLYSAERIFINLKKRNITHILIRYDLYNKWVQDNYNTKEREVVRQFYNNHLNLLYSKHGHGLYQLKIHAVEES